MRVGVLGIGKTPHKIQHHKSLRDLIVEAGRLAMDDAGVGPEDVQALYLGNAASGGFNYESSVGLMGADHLGLVPAPAVRVEAACGTGAWALHLGCVAILSGLYDTVMVMGAEKMNDLATVEGTSIIAQAADSKEEYFSGLTFPSGVALTARKYMETYGLTEEDLAHTSVKNHHYGARNPDAHLRFECTVEEVMRSAKVADPLKLYEVCPMTDAGSALVLCRRRSCAPSLSGPRSTSPPPRWAREPGTRPPTPWPTPTPCWPVRPGWPTRWPACRPRTWTWPRSTTRSRSRSRWGSRPSASPSRARDGWAPRTARPGSKGGWG